MAMTKKEREAHEHLLKEVRILGALRFTDTVEEDVPAPKNGESRYTTGYLFNSFSLRIDNGKSESHRHIRGDSRYSWSQGSRDLFSTRLLAMKAMRNEVERESAEKLAKIDEMIAAEIAATKPV